MGRRGIFQVRARSLQSLAQGGHRLALAHHDFFHLNFNGEQPLHLALPHPLQRNAGPLGDDV